MHEINFYGHKRFLSGELRRLIKDGTLAAYTWQQLGNELQSALIDGSFAEESDYYEHFSVEYLYHSLYIGWRFDHDWLREDDGSFLSDDGQAIPDSVPKAFSEIDHLAAYALWKITVDFDSCGFASESGLNDQGFSPAMVVSHKAECILLAYQALSFSQKLLLGEKLDRQEIEKAVRTDTALKAVAERHAFSRSMKAEAIRLYCNNDKKWPSRRQAAKMICPLVQAYGKEKHNKCLSIDRAEQTIYEWLSKHDRRSKNNICAQTYNVTW